MPEVGEGCVEPARGVISEVEPAETLVEQVQNPKEDPKMSARVGKPAPDFEANAYADGGFKTVKLSDYKGQWVVVCFYPGDFTFV